MPYIILFPEENDNFLVAIKSDTEGLNRVIGLNFAEGIGQPQKVKPNQKTKRLPSQAVFARKPDELDDDGLKAKPQILEV